MFRAVKRCHALNTKRGSFIARNPGAHFAKQHNQIGYFRLARRVFEDRFAVRERCCHQNVFRSGDRDFFENDVTAFKPATLRSARFNVAVRRRNLRAHFF